MLVGELLERAPSDPLRQRYFSCDIASGPACVGQVIANLATAAWRRPVTDAELAPYLAAAQAQPDAATGLRVALRAGLDVGKVPLLRTVGHGYVHVYGGLLISLTRLSTATSTEFFLRQQLKEAKPGAASLVYAN